MTATTVGCYGKLPGHGDFLRVVGAHSPVEVLDTWLATAGLDQRDRAATFDAASPAFTIVCTRGMWWGCALFPSRDSVGRRYPFTVFTGVPIADLADAGYLAVAAFLPFFMRTWQAAQQGWPADQAVLRAGLPNLAAPVDLTQEERRFVATLDTTTLGDVANGLFGAATEAQRAAVIADLLAVAGGAQPAGGVRFQPMAHQNHLGFWLMVLTLCGAKPVVPSVITLRFAHGGAPPAATLLFDHPAPAACLAGLWPELAARGTVAPHDVVTQAGQLGEADEVPAELLAAGQSLRDVAHGLASLTRQRRTMRITRRPTVT